MQDDKLIIYAKRDQNLFILDLITLGKIMQVNRIANITITTSQKKSTYLISYNKKMRVWYKRFKYISNTKIIATLKLLTRIGDFNTNYNQAKIYSK